MYTHNLNSKNITFRISIKTKIKSYFVELASSMYTLPRPGFLTKSLPAKKENHREKKKHLNYINIIFK